ncbi:type III polyketide synthase [Lentibacillus cibarius]|uniref:type III polyketide synthase n=1 Tax=Lentibacillus cibarius TaxID=2583219 RepID=UPI001F234061|nr:3-oxoacyl-[acyl-carrier-protein] synthase III C-terminal domain-containing protein [Lentibacillus cibarius]
MVISSIGLGVPQHNMSQQTVKTFVSDVFHKSASQFLERMMPVFDNACIDNRQFAVNQEWLKNNHTFKEKNDLYQHFAQIYSLQAIDACLKNNQLLNENIPYEAIDMIIFVSSTGIATPSIDTYIMNERPFREDVIRMPLWGLGCAGGAIGLSRAFDWISAHPDKNVLLICCELCSLTFQKNDSSKSNLVGTALFGDGAAAALLMGESSSSLSSIKDFSTKPRIIETSTKTKKNSNSVMGWDVTDRGLEVIFSKSIPAQVRSFWKRHIHTFLAQLNLTGQSIHSFIAHPGGKKVLEAMEDVLQAPQEKFRHSYRILRNHGNMSSVTVLYVMYEWMKEGVPENMLSIISALGPGFSSELLLLEWKK